MSCSRSWTDESGTTSIDSSEDREETNSSNCASGKKHNRNVLNKDIYKVSSEQIIVHRWFLSDIHSLNNQEEGCYLQSSSFGCTGENGFLQWIIRFYPIAPPSSSSTNKHSTDTIDHNESLRKAGNNSALGEVLKDDGNVQQALLTTLRNMISNKENQTPLSYTESLHQLLSEILQKPISTIEQSTITKEDVKEVIPSSENVHIPILNQHVLKTLPQDSITTSEEESLSDDKSYCAFEVLKINGTESSSQALFETNYQIFEVADDGILSLLKTEGRHQVHFNRALIILPRDIIFSTSSTNILFSIKLIIYECSSTVDYWQPTSNNNKSIKKLSYEESYLSNISSGDANRFYNNNPSIELSPGNIFWFMSIQKLFTDTILCSSDGQEFHIHRLILYRSCEKLTDLIDKNEQMNRIEIQSVNGSILKRILKYIYTGEIEICFGEFSIDEFRDLLNAADLFELFQLKNILTKKCLNHITQKNCFDLLQIADDKQIKILKNRILIFLSQQFSQMFNTELWQQFRTTRPHLYDETFANLIRLTHLQKSIIEHHEEKNHKN